MNSVLIHSGDEGILIDPGILPEEIKNIDNYLTENKIKIQNVIITHSHWDHIIGVDYFSPENIITHKYFKIETKGIKGAQLIKQIHSFWELHKIKEQEFHIPQPNQLIDNEYKLNLGNLVLNLIYTPGHARDHISIIIPGQKLLIAGDLLSDREIPYVNHSLSKYIKTVSKLSNYDLDIVIPGHGSSTKSKDEVTERLNRDREYLKQLEALAKSAIKNNLKVEELKNIADKISYPFPELNNSGHLLNLESAYIELGGSANPGKYGWGQDLIEIQ